MKTAEMIPFTAETVAVQRPSFWRIADDLEAYHETIVMLDAQIQTCADAQERELLWAEHAEVGQHIERLSEALVKKTDDLAGVMRRMKSDAASLKDEEARLRGRRQATEAALESLKGYTRSTMDKHGWKRLKTAQNTIAIRGNGGVQPLVIDDPRNIPPAYKDTVLKITCDEYDRLWNAMISACVAPSMKLVEANNARLREALSQPCANCDGSGSVMANADEVKTCPTCGGSGRASVPGAHLEERGSHLELR